MCLVSRSSSIACIFSTVSCAHALTHARSIGRRYPETLEWLTVDEFRARLHSLRDNLAGSVPGAARLVARCPTVILQTPATTAAKLHAWGHLLGLPTKEAAALLCKYPSLLMSSQARWRGSVILI